MGVDECPDDTRLDWVQSSFDDGERIYPSPAGWPALVLEGFAQLGGKRAQKKLLGPMRSLNWTDHANMTKQQQVELVDIDIKLLRWVSEIVADGSEIRSLAGRSARLGDGTSRNPVIGMSYWSNAPKIWQE